MRAIKPELVDMSKAKYFSAAMKSWRDPAPMIGLGGQPARPGWLVEDLNAEGACGNAAAAREEAGEVLIESAGRGFADFLRSFAAFDHRGTAP